jgi:hypothetical protein
MDSAMRLGQPEVAPASLRYPCQDALWDTQKINSVSFIQVTDDDGRQLFFIPAWAMGLAVILFILFFVGRKQRKQE